MRKPDFFIVGAGKSGTTALYEYLRAHPRIFMSDVKEPRYFADDMPGLLNRVATEEPYLSLFDRAEKSHLAVGEASPQYLYSATAIRNIRAFNAASKLIVMLRNPIDLSHAAHAECLYWGVEYEQDFEKAWRLQPLRRAGRCVPRACTQATVLLWSAMARLGEQVQRLLDVFPREQVAFVFFEDFVRDTKRVYAQILDFLGVPNDGRRAFPRFNENRRNRSRLLGRILLNPPRGLDGLKRAAQRLPVARDVWRMLTRLNTAPAARRALRPAFRAELVEEFREDILKLSSLLRRDLQNWLA